MQWRLCQVLLAIISVLIFQIFSLIALEMNVYVITEGSDNNTTIPKFVKKFDELNKLNDIKPPFMLSFGSEYQTKGRTGEFEIPGS